VAIVLLVGLTISVPIIIVLNHYWTSKPRNFDGNDRSIEVKTSEKFNITLGSNPSTGYRWQLAKPLDETIIKFINSEYKIISNEDGAWQKEIWTFEAVGVGTTEIFMEYLRPWEDAPPIYEQNFTVVVA